MGELERNMRDDVGQPQGNAPSTDNGGQMDMFEDECQRASWRRRGAIARGVAKRCLVAFLAFAMAFGTTPAQLWAEGAEGIAGAVAQAATPSEGTGAADGAADQGKAEVSDSGSAPAASAATIGAATGDEGSVTGENPTASEQSSTAFAGQAGSAAATAVQTENPTETGDVAKKQVEVSFSIIGTDADGKAQTWVAPTQLKLDEGATAADAFVKLQQKTGFKADYDANTAYGFYLKSITSPTDSRTLAYDATTGAFWQLFVDGASSSVGASSVKLTQGQKIEFAYTAGSSSPVVKDQLAANVTVIGRDAQGKTQTWVDNAQYVVTSGSSALDLTKVALEANDIDAVAAGSFILSLKYNGVELGTRSIIRPIGSCSLTASRATTRQTMSPFMLAIPLRGSTVAGATSCRPIPSMLPFRSSVRTRTASSRFGLRRARRVSRRVLLPRISLSRPALLSMLANRLGAGSSTALLRRSMVSPMAGMLRPIAIGAST